MKFIAYLSTALIRVNNGAESLHNAAHYGHLHTLANLIEIKQPIDAYDKGGRTALAHALLMNRIDCALYLLGHGADPNNLYADNARQCKFINNIIGLSTRKLLILFGLAIRFFDFNKLEAEESILTDTIEKVMLIKTVISTVFLNTKNNISAASSTTEIEQAIIITSELAKDSEDCSELKKFYQKKLKKLQVLQNQFNAKETFYEVDINTNQNSNKLKLQ